MAKQLDSRKMKDVLATALRRFEEASSTDSDERDLAIEDYSFAFNEDGQWDDLAKNRRRNKPRYTINKVAAAVNEIIGNYRQNRIEAKAIPEVDVATEEAKAYQGLLKSILSTPDAKLAKDVAFKLITTSGFGAMRVLNKFTEGNPFHQEVCVEPIYEALTTVTFDPFAKHPTGKDGDYVFETTKVSRKEFKRLYPDASMAAWPDSEMSNLQVSWGIGNALDDIRIADYYVKEPVKTDLVLLSDGSIIDKEAFDNTVDELAEQGIEFVDERRTTVFKVMHYKMSGAEILEQPVEVPSQYLPIVRVLGYNEWHENVLHYRGIVRPAKDSQRVYNYAVSANIEAVALAPKNKVLATKKMIQGHESSWSKLNTSDQPVLTYTPDSSAAGGAPVPYNAAQPVSGLIQQSQQAELDIQSTIGRRAPAQAENANDRSGRAILALQRQDDSVTFELLDNLAKSEEQVGNIVIDMIPNVYDTERQVMILGDDDEEEIVTINNTIKDDDTGEEYKVNDTSIKYRVKTTVGPAFETKRSEMVNTLSTLAQDDAIKPLVVDLLAKSMDMPYAEELTKRLRKQQIAQGVVEPNEDEAKALQEQQSTPEAQQQAMIAQQRQQIQLATEMAALKQQQLTNANLEANIADLQANTFKKMKDAEKSDADTNKSRSDTYETLLASAETLINNNVPVPRELIKAIENALELVNTDMQDELQQRLTKILQQTQQVIG